MLRGAKNDYINASLIDVSTNNFSVLFLPYYRADYIF